MFTGIIQGLGTLFEKRPAGGGMIFGLEADFLLIDPEEGGVHRREWRLSDGPQH